MDSTVPATSTAKEPRASFLSLLSEATSRNAEQAKDSQPTNSQSDDARPTDRGTANDQSNASKSSAEAPQSAPPFRAKTNVGASQQAAPDPVAGTDGTPKLVSGTDGEPKPARSESSSKLPVNKDRDEKTTTANSFVYDSLQALPGVVPAKVVNAISTASDSPTMNSQVASTAPATDDQSGNVADQVAQATTSFNKGDGVKTEATNFFVDHEMPASPAIQPAKALETGIAAATQAASNARVTEDQSGGVASQLAPTRISASNVRDVKVEAGSAFTYDPLRGLPGIQPEKAVDSAHGRSQAAPTASPKEDQSNSTADQIASANSGDQPDRIAQASFAVNASPLLRQVLNSVFDSDTAQSQGHTPQSQADAAIQAAAGVQGASTTSSGFPLPVNLDPSVPLNPVSVPQNDGSLQGTTNKFKSDKSFDSRSNAADLVRNASDTGSDVKSKVQKDVPNTHLAQAAEQQNQLQLSGDAQANPGQPQAGSHDAAQSAAFAAHVAGAQVVTNDHVQIAANDQSIKANDNPVSAHSAAYPQSDEVNAGNWTGTHGLNTARVIQSMNQTEMRVGMRSQEFGDISIRTSVSERQMQTQISVDHNELGKVISTHLPSMQTKFVEEFGLQATIEVNQSGGSLTGREGGSPQQHNGAPARPLPSGNVMAVAGADSIAALSTQIAANDGRLDIRA